MGMAIFLEQDIFNGCRIIFDKAEYTVSADFYNKFESFLNDNAKVIKSLNDKVENQRKELASLLAKNKKLEEENQKLRDSLELVEVNLKSVRKKAEKARDEYEKMKEVLKRWHEATGCDNFDQAKKKIENMAKEIQEWKDATCRYSPEQAKVRYDWLKASNMQLQALVYGVGGCYKPVDIGGENQRPLCDYLANRGYSGAVDAINKLEKEIREFRDDKEGRRTLIQYKSDRINKLHNMIWGGPGYHPLIVGGELRTAKGYLEHKGYKSFVDAVANLEADIALLKNHEIQCAEGTYTIFIHPHHMNALQIDVKHDRYQAETRLIEECSELIQALAKRKRAYSPEVNYIGSHELMELAHVIISAIVYCRYWGISNELLQKAVQVKYPEPYED